MIIFNIDGRGGLSPAANYTLVRFSSSIFAYPILMTQPDSTTFYIEVHGIYCSVDNMPLIIPGQKEISLRVFRALD